MVAVSMAVYNDQRYLTLALQALCEQTFRDFHVTLYDDGSTDGSVAVAEGFASRLPLSVVRGEHVGLQRAKKAAWLHALPSQYLMMLDADIVLPPGALARMVAALDADVRVAAVSARYRASGARPFGPAQAFIDDFLFATIGGDSGESESIVGGCTLLRREAVTHLDVRTDLSEDHELSQKLRANWRLLLPPDLVATHHGVPGSLWGVLRRFYREGIRVRALHRAYAGTLRVGSVARLASLPLFALLAAGVVLAPRMAAASLALLLAYVAAFLLASRGVPARLPDRLGGALLFTFANVGYGAGYLREALRGRSEVMREPPRSA